MASDALIQRYEPLLDGSYDCVDRIAVSAYFGLGQTPGGFRVWWRQLYGDDEKLDDAHLMRFAGHCARRVQAWATAHQIPLIRCETGERKHELAEDHLPTDPTFKGVFCVMIARAPAPLRKVRRWGKSGMDITVPARQAHANHYYFHIMDPEWGHLTVRLCPHPPFGALVLLNGHEWVERRARQAGIGFTKEGNCFTNIVGAADLEHHADTMKAEGFEGRVVQVCERWLYSACLGFALATVEQKRSNFRYSYSLHQAELSRNLLFTRGRVMERVFQALVDRTRAPLDIKTVSTIFGYQRRPYKRNRRGEAPRMQCVVERPAYDLTVFKIHFGRLSAKIYTKGERVLRIEIIAHNTADLRCGRSIGKWGAILRAMGAILERFVAVLQAVDTALIDLASLESWPRPERLGKVRVGGVDVNRPRTRAVMEAVVALSLNPRGFALADLAERTGQILGVGPEVYRKRQAAYDLKKFRAKGLVEAVAGSRRYQASQRGLSAMAALLVLRDKVIVPLVAAAGKPAQVIPAAADNDLNNQYRRVQTEMLGLFEKLGLAA